MKTLSIIFGLSILLCSCDGAFRSETPKEVIIQPVVEVKVQKYCCESIDKRTGDSCTTISRTFYNPGDLVLMGGSDGETSQVIIECTPFKN